MGGRLGFGCVKLGSIAAGRGERSSQRLIHRAIDHGVTYFDTADAYGAGTSEHLLGRAIRGRRDTVMVATKGGYLFSERSRAERRMRQIAAPVLQRMRRSGSARPNSSAGARTGAYQQQDFSARYLTSALDGSLRRLATDYIDVYQLHDPYNVDVVEIAEWADSMISSGRIRRFGIGAASVAQAMEWRDCGVATAILLPFGVLDPEAAEDAIPTLAGVGKELRARGVLAAGLLPSHSDERLRPAQARTMDRIHRLSERTGLPAHHLALSYVLSFDAVRTAVVGVSSPAHLDDLVMGASASLAEDVRSELRAAARCDA